jgi:hypothetical protein
LIGETVDAGRVRDVAAALGYLRGVAGKEVRRVVAGARGAGLLGAYAVLMGGEAEEVVVIDPPGSHMESVAPKFLNVLRVLDVGEALGLLAPKGLRIEGGPPALRARVKSIYEVAGASGRLDAGD